MSDRFANVYWSSDCKTGIDNLCLQSNKSISQVHELRQLVFSYMNYYHANSQYLHSLAVETGNGNSFRVDEARGRDRSRIPSKLAQNHVYEGRTESQSDSHFHNVKALDTPPVPPKDSKTTSNGFPNSRVSMETPFNMYLEDLTREAQTLFNLATAIDRNVLEDINMFIKSYEPYIRSTVDRLGGLFGEYESVYSEVETIKLNYDEYNRLKEFADNEARNKQLTIEEDEENVEENDEGEGDGDGDGSNNNNNIEKTQPQHMQHNSDNESDNESFAEDNNDLDFDFPLLIGSVKVKSQDELSAFLNIMVSKVPTSKRTFLLPGHNPETFTSEDMCKVIIEKRPFRFNPTRLNLERFGQGLLDLNLIQGTGLIKPRKFKSEGMWFEWSDLSIYISEYSEPQQPSNTSSNKSSSSNTPNTTPNTKSKNKLLFDENTTKQMATTTSKKFNHMFKSMKLSIMNTDYNEKLKNLEHEYNEKYYDLHELRYLINTEIIDNGEKLENFEKSKIRLVYNSLTKLLEIIYNFSLTSTTRLHKFASSLITEINNPHHYDNDFNHILNTFTTGIYSPSLLSPKNLTNHQYNTAQANNNFQNLKLQFNLYKDIPLQLQMSQINKDNILSFTSLPLFVYQLIRSIEEMSHDVEESDTPWINPIDHQRHWSLKERIINQIKDLEFDDISVDNELLIQQNIIESVINLLKKESLPDLVNYTKNWLLEIGDSLIPCLVYDSIVCVYKRDESDEKGDDKKDDNSHTSKELVKILSSIPRSNLATLLFLIEHISEAFSLNQIPSFGLSDELPTELKATQDIEQLENVTKQLNSMESIGAIPFIHLIMRPSPIKTATGLKPPIDIYNRLLKHLLHIEVRSELFINLVNNEKNYISKKESEKNNLGLQKLPIPPSPKKPNTTPLSMPKSPRPTTAENFTLRPFRTKVTPMTSPNNSPNNLAKERFEQRLGTPEQKPRERSSSGRERSISGNGSFLAPGIDIEFGEKN